MNFTAKDLALVLPDNVGDIYALRHTGSDESAANKFEPLKPKLDQSKKVTRYFSGKVPTWANDDDYPDSIIGVIDRNSDFVQTEVGYSNKEDRRLARIAAVSKPATAADRRRRIYEAEVVEEDISEPRNDYAPDNSGLDEIDFETNVDMSAFAENEDEDDNDDIMARRARAAQRLSMKALEFNREESVNPEEDSEYETDSDETSEEEDKMILKPIFIPKEKRETIKRLEEKQRLEELQNNEKLLQLEERKKQTRLLVAESIRREEERKELLAHAAGNDSDTGLPDDTDDADDEEEYEGWKLREITRMKREAEEREKFALEKADVDRRRKMTQEERDAEDAKLGRGKFQVKEKAKWKFMQKYYHKGVFYMDESSVSRDHDDVRKMEFDAPTLEDRFDKEKLPKVLQVKNFGRRGRTKYTHLVDQDTTNFNLPLRPNEQLKTSYMNKRAGVGDIETLGGKSKKQK